MDLSSQQAKAVEAAGTWLKTKDKQVFYLAGYAGTGKTTLAKYLAAQQDKDFRFAAFTGKAASVLRSKGCNATTIHSLIYALQEPNQKAVEATIKQIRDCQSPTLLGQLKVQLKELQRPKFDLNRDSILKDLGLLIVDEVSMVDEAIGKDLLSFGTKILVLGDPAQLPPVNGEGFFTKDKPDFLLTEIHRQAAGNPIISMATIVRQGNFLRKGSYGESKVVDRRTLEIEEITSFSQAIVGRNKTRKELNSLLRDKIGFLGNIPEPSEKLICLKNNKELGILNGTQWICQKAEDNGIYIRLELLAIDNKDEEDLESLILDCHHFDIDVNALPFWERNRLEEFDFGYAITCHKSQGSQWPTVYIQNESYVFREQAKNWLYTALTRAETKVLVGV